MFKFEIMLQLECCQKYLILEKTPHN